MKTIGLVGGMSWESTVTYYQAINEGVKKALGGLHSAKIVMESVEFSEIEECQRNGDWEKTARILGAAAQHLESIGADAIFICTNTMHKVAPQVQTYISVPLVHIAQATAEAIHAQGLSRIGLLGTRYTMTEDFYVGQLKASSIDVLIPDEKGVAETNRIIFEELCLGIIRPESKEFLVNEIDTMKSHGAEGVILGCTEIGLIISQVDTNLAVFDTTLVHAAKAIEIALSD